MLRFIQMTAPMDYDNPWKEALRRFLRSFLRLCFPYVETALDWSRKPEFLDKELLQITRDAASGKRYVDLLVKVWLVDGVEEWILLHVEVQHRADPDFELRLFRYNYRVFDVYGKRVSTLAILADADPRWRPSYFEMTAPGCRTRFDFSVCKLLDLTSDIGLQASREPSAVVVLANWAVQQAGKDDERRLAWKWDLTRRLYELGLAKDDILELYRLIDWLLRLPREMEARFKRQLMEYEQKQVMPYITSIERLGREEGKLEGKLEGQLLNLRENILDLLEARFSKAPFEAREQVNAETDVARLKSWLRLAGTCARIEDFNVSSRR